MDTQLEQLRISFGAHPDTLFPSINWEVDYSILGELLSEKGSRLLSQMDGSASLTKLFSDFDGPIHEFIITFKKLLANDAIMMEQEPPTPQDSGEKTTLGISLGPAAGLSSDSSGDMTMLEPLHRKPARQQPILHNATPPPNHPPRNTHSPGFQRNPSYNSLPRRPQQNYGLPQNAFTPGRTVTPPPRIQQHGHITQEVQQAAPPHNPTKEIKRVAHQPSNRPQSSYRQDTSANPSHASLLKQLSQTSPQMHYHTPSSPGHPSNAGRLISQDAILSQTGAVPTRELNAAPRNTTPRNHPPTIQHPRPVLPPQQRQPNAQRPQREGNVPTRELNANPHQDSYQDPSSTMVEIPSIRRQQSPPSGSFPRTASREQRPHSQPKFYATNEPRRMPPPNYNHQGRPHPTRIQTPQSNPQLRPPHLQGHPHPQRTSPSSHQLRAQRRPNSQYPQQPAQYPPQRPNSGSYPHPHPTHQSHSSPSMEHVLEFNLTTEIRTVSSRNTPPFGENHFQKHPSRNNLPSQKQPQHPLHNKKS